MTYIFISGLQVFFFILSGKSRNYCRQNLFLNVPYSNYASHGDEEATQKIEHKSQKIWHIQKQES